MYRLHIAALALFASTVLAADNPGIPTCAFDCISGYGGCGQLDVGCICSNTAYIAHMACCVSKSCNKADQEATLKFANALCAGQNVNDLPQTATCPASASTASSSTGTASTSTGTAATSGSTTTSGTTTTTATGAQTTTTTNSNAASAASSSAAAATTSPGAAVRHSAEGLGIGMFVAGLVAAL